MEFSLSNIIMRFPYFSSPNSSLLTIRLHYFSSPGNSSPYDSSPLLFVSTTFRLQAIRLLTIRLHYYSSPLLFVCRQFVSLRSVSTTIYIRINYNSILYSLIDVINNAGKKFMVEVLLVSN